MRSLTVQYAVPAILIPQIHADGHRPRVACLRYLLQTPLRTATLRRGEGGTGRPQYVHST